MKEILFLIIGSLFLLAGCSSAVETQDEMPAEMQDDEETDHMSVVGNTNMFLDIVGVNKNLSIKSMEVNYFENSVGYVAMPDDEKVYPGVVLIHEWWGLNDNIKDVANVLASEGYTVFAVDLYNGEVATTPEKAMELRRSVDNQITVENMKSAIEYLRNEVGVSNVASMGFCFGGEQSGLLSISDAQLDATVIYYGSVPQNLSDIENVDAPVLGIFGENDTGITPDTVRVFEDGLNQLGLENDITIYEGVGHAFANPGGSRFAEEETRDAWSKTLLFLDENLN